MFRKAFFCNVEIGIYFEEENHEKLSNHCALKRRLVVSLQNTWLVGLAESLKQNSKLKSLSGGTVSRASVHLALLWQLSFGKACCKLQVAAGKRGTKTRPDFSPSPHSPEPAMLTYLPQLQEKAATAFLEELKLLRFLSTSSILHLPPFLRLPVCVRSTALLQQLVWEAVWYNWKDLAGDIKSSRSSDFALVLSLSELPFPWSFSFLKLYWRFLNC